MTAHDAVILTLLAVATIAYLCERSNRRACERDAAIAKGERDRLVEEKRVAAMTDAQVVDAVTRGMLGARGPRP